MKKLPGLYLISIGDELLDGRTQNSNASYFGQVSKDAGLQIAEIRTVSDRLPDIIRALKDANRYEFVFVTGGLGPTNDDRTNEAAAKAFRLPWQRHKQAEKMVREKYAKRNVEINEVRLRQARLPKGAKLFSNPNGIAPPYCLNFKGTLYFFAPGVPGECRPLFQEQILPILSKKMRAKPIIDRQIWRCFGAGESEMFLKISPLVEAWEKKFKESVVIGVHIHFPCVDVSMQLRKATHSPTKSEWAEMQNALSEKLGEWVYSREKKSLVEVVLDQLLANRFTLSTTESCTGGWVAKLLTDIPGSSKTYLGSVVSYANEAKEKILGVQSSVLLNHGAVSESVVREMAESGRRLFQSTYCLALSGISGPSGGNEEKPVGTIHIALASPHGTKTMHQVIFGGQLSREQNRLYSTHLALNLLRLTMNRVD